MMPGTRSTAVVVLNWNGVNHLQTYLPSVLTHTPSDVAVWVVDNGSEDASVDWLQNNVANVFRSRTEGEPWVCGGV